MKCWRSVATIILEIYEYDFKNKEVAARRENCLEVGLATTALSIAYQNASFDVACILAGDIDYQSTD